MEVNNPGHVTNSEILKSIQSITEVMQQQLLLNSKTTEQGIVQMASLFQEMIKAQEKRDLDPALLAIPTFSGETKDRPQCLDWVSRVKNVCDQSGRSFHQEPINQLGILVQNFIRSLKENITNRGLPREAFLGEMVVGHKNLVIKPFHERIMRTFAKIADKVGKRVCEKLLYNVCKYVLFLFQKTEFSSEL